MIGDQSIEITINVLRGLPPELKIASKQARRSQQNDQSVETTPGPTFHSKHRHPKNKRENQHVSTEQKHLKTNPLKPSQKPTGPTEQKSTQFEKTNLLPPKPHPKSLHPKLRRNQRREEKDQSLRRALHVRSKKAPKPPVLLSERLLR